MSKSKARAMRASGATIDQVAVAFQIHYSTAATWCDGVRPRLPVRECGFCGKPFHPSRESQLFHHRECKQNNMRWRQSFPQFQTRQQQFSQENECRDSRCTRP